MGFHFGRCFKSGIGGGSRFKQCRLQVVQGLLTGNLEPNATTKLEAAGARPPLSAPPPPTAAAAAPPPPPPPALCRVAQEEHQTDPPGPQGSRWMCLRRRPRCALSSRVALMPSRSFQQKQPPWEVAASAAISTKQPP